jgi:hypothetical protein
VKPLLFALITDNALPRHLLSLRQILLLITGNETLLSLKDNGLDVVRSATRNDARDVCTVSKGIDERVSKMKIEAAVALCRTHGWAVNHFFIRIVQWALVNGHEAAVKISNSHILQSVIRLCAKMRV